GRSETPTLSPDGQTLYFARAEQIDGKSQVDGAVVNARLGYSNIVRKPSGGGTEEILLNGLTKAANGFHQVKWYLAPALSPDGTQLAFLWAQSFTIDLWVLDLGTALSSGGVPKTATKITNGEGVDGADRPSWGR